MYQVRNVNRLWALSEFGVSSGASVEAIVTISKYAGMSKISGMATDRHGNVIGAESELALDGGFAGHTVAILNLCGINIGNPITALRQQGFTERQWTSIPSISEFNNVLSNCIQLWVISTTSAILPSQHITSVLNFYNSGKSLLLLGDNDPCNEAVNQIIPLIFPGVRLHQNYPACKYVTPRNSPNGAGFDPHPIFTGISNLYEGHTIARYSSSHPRLKFIMSSTEPSPSLAICDDNLNGCGRVAIDCAFTRLYCSWDDAGSSKYVKNIAAWLCGLDSDWL